MTLNEPTSNSEFLTNLGLTLVAIAVGGSIVLWLPAWFLGTLQHEKVAFPGVGIVVTLVRHPFELDKTFNTVLNPATYWLLVILLLSVLITATLLGLKKIHAARTSPQWDIHKQNGVAKPAEFSKVFSTRAIEKAAKYLRPTLENPHAEDVAYLLGTSFGQKIWMSCEDSCILLGPARSGKGQNFVLPMIIEAPGAVVSTSVRAENYENTVKYREKTGPIGVFAPNQDLPTNIKWSLVKGCEIPEIAMRRAAAITANSAKGVENAGFWENQGQKIIAPLLHAAALDGGGTQLLFEWATSPSRAAHALNTLRTNPLAASGWAAALDAALHGQDPRTLSNIWTQVDTAITKPLMSPRLLQALSPNPGQEIDVERFIKDKGSFYVIDDTGLAAAFIAAMVEDFYYKASKNLANQSPGNRLDPPILFSLDELANIAKLPALPDMISAGGGSGCTTLAVLQSLAQARDRWGRDSAEAVWEAATTRLILGGLTDSQELEAISKITGRKKIHRRSTSDNPTGTKSHSIQEQDEVVLTPAQVRSLPPGVALIVSRHVPPIVLDTIRHQKREYQKQ